MRIADQEEESVASMRSTGILNNREPRLRNPSEVFRRVFGAHGRLRYESGAGAFNGAVALVQSSEAYERECAFGVPSSDLHGAGAVWAWFVGSPRAFTFGFVRSASWAARKMRTQLEAKYESATGKIIGPRKRRP